MEKENLILKITEFLKDEDNGYISDGDLTLCDYFDIESLSISLNDNELISFSIQSRTSVSGSDSWLQVEYYSQKISKQIIYDYDAVSDFQGETTEELIAVIAEYFASLELKIRAFEEKLSINI